MPRPYKLCADDGFRVGVPKQGVPKQVTEPCADDELVWAPPSRAL